MIASRLLPSLLLLGWLLTGTASPLPAQIPPDARWRTFETANFRVTFGEGLEPVARRAAERAEHAHALLTRELVRPPENRIDLVLSDNVDFANGYAMTFPTNRVVVYVHPRASELSLSFYEDWLDLVVLHELVHIFHRDHSGGVWRRLRSVFGRNPVLFPQLFLPNWVTEGLATYLESELTRAGRVRGTQHEMVLRTAVLQDSFFPIDRATGDPVAWPGGGAPYIYGGHFLHHLARRHGPEAVSEFVRAVGRQLVPYRPDAAARRAFGVSFTRAWRGWEDSLRSRYSALADSLEAEGVTRPEVLTRAGRMASFPRYAPDGSALAYSAATGREEPALRLVLADGSQRTVAPRTTLGPAAWTPDARALLFAQLDYTDPYHILSDLYRAGAEGGEERLTRAARVWEPDLHPDGRRVVVVAEAEGTNALEIRDLAGGGTRRLREPSLDVHWALPRWSPAGDRIAVSRWRAGGLYDVVVLDSTGAVLRELTSDRAVDAAPAWSPDGRWVLFSSDRSGISNLYVYDLEADRLLQVTNVLTGAFQPDVSPDGRWIAFSYYQADGFHIARIPFEPSSWRPAPPPRGEAARALDPLTYGPPPGGEARPYSPWPTLAPATWIPLFDAGTDLDTGVGVALSGVDLVGRHQWAAQALLYPEGARLNGEVYYRYRGLGNPVLDLSLRQEWSEQIAAGTVIDDKGTRLPTTLLGRERTLGASAAWVRRRIRSTAWLEAGGEVVDLHREWDEPHRAGSLRFRQIPLDRGATLQLGYSTARSFGLSVGPQQGFLTSTTLQARRYAEPFTGDSVARGYLRWTGRGRAYRSVPLPGFARHVLALRADLGVENGSVSPGLRVGGASGARAPIPLDLDLFGEPLGFPIRGYRPGVQRGNRALVTSLEYRFPLVMVERGFRTHPIFLDRVWGDIFADAGGAWCAGQRCRERFGAATPTRLRPIGSVGAELNVDLTTGYFVDLPLRAGVAWPLDEAEPRRPQLYLRVGRSF